MIKKISSIKNLAVFRNFEWDKCVLNKAGGVISFATINVLYGRNYSGKTSLSRIVRAIETGTLSDKYDNPEFSVTLDDKTSITQATLLGHNKVIRVFNEDFVKDNLRCISNPEDCIEPFAVIFGEDNNKIELEIEALQKEIGFAETGKETGLYAELKAAEKKHGAAFSGYTKVLSSLDKRLSDKAIDRTNGIKYHADKFGDINYTKAKLESDIRLVLQPTFIFIDDDKKDELIELINQQTKSPISKFQSFDFSINDFVIKTKGLVGREIAVSDKITEILRDVVLNNWVKQGCELHKGKRTNCLFCGSEISDTRWAILNKHFDEESKKLEDEILDLKTCIIEQKEKVKLGFSIDKKLFYSKYYSKIDSLIEQYAILSTKYIDQLDILIDQLEKRVREITTILVYEEIQDHSKGITDILTDYEAIRIESNKYTELLGAEQADAKKKLRLKEVSDFVMLLDYEVVCQNIKSLKDEADAIQIEKNTIQYKINNKNQEIKTNKQKLNNEEKGAAKVNELLNNFFGNDSLSLSAIKDETTSDKQIRFEIIRNGKKAYNLSEGECSLVAFCYFMAKLNDVNTMGAKPIIWIDDPISSLDGNHIYFIYSLIAAEVTEKCAYEQLFISTHNLEFLKYLKRIKGKYVHSDTDCSKEYFIISRHDSDSIIIPMPKYMKNYVTEFNYLFHEIYLCSCIDVVDDTNYTSFYNFGNNARKFLEIYLFYKYPDYSEDRIKMQRFFGEGKIPVMFTERVTNEYSHLAGNIERATLPIEVPEMLTVAKLIIEKMKEEDVEQYTSLLNSIEVAVLTETTGS